MSHKGRCSYCFKAGLLECSELAGCWNRPGGPISSEDPRFDAEVEQLMDWDSTVNPEGYSAQIRNRLRKSDD